MNETADNQQTKPQRPIKGFIIAGVSLALLFGIAYWKGRVMD